MQILKIKFFYSTSRKLRKYNHPNGSVYSMVYLSVGCGDLCLQIHLSVRWLGVMFAMGFVSSLVGGYVWYWVCLFVGWGLCLVLGLSGCWLVAM